MNERPLFAITAPGIEHITAAELRGLGIAGVPERGGVAWRGTMADVHSTNLRIRTASRILVRVGVFRARSFAELERRLARLDWTAFLAPGTPIRLRVSSSKSRLYHERAIAERVNRVLTAETGAVPTDLSVVGEDDAVDAPETSGAQLLVVRFHRDECTISADASGELLHRRGYRQAIARAPLRETLAAAMLLGSGWDPRRPLIDPFCGSGTLPIEAALLARDIAPGIASSDLVPRAYAFLRWPSHDADGWARAVDEARARVRPRAPAPILGSDRDAGAIDAASANAARAGVTADIELQRLAVSAIHPQDHGGFLVTNPPYGARVGERRPLRDLYATLGKVARDRFAGWTIALLSAEQSLESQIGIRFEEKFRTRNGGIAVRLLTGRSDGEAPRGARPTDASGE